MPKRNYGNYSTEKHDPCSTNLIVSCIVCSHIRINYRLLFQGGGVGKTGFHFAASIKKAEHDSYGRGRGVDF